jgi:hypothetical protein
VYIIIRNPEMFFTNRKSLKTRMICSEWITSWYELALYFSLVSISFAMSDIYITSKANMSTMFKNVMNCFHGNGKHNILHSISIVKDSE